ncbi:MAG TPA: class I lanthipeptide [Thermoanaerobaculia bacterium]
MKKKVQKLRLHKETLHLLKRDELSHVAGGQTTSCLNTDIVSCCIICLGPPNPTEIDGYCW